MGRNDSIRAWRLGLPPVRHLFSLLRIELASLWPHTASASQQHRVSLGLGLVWPQPPSSTECPSASASPARLRTASDQLGLGSASAATSELPIFSLVSSSSSVPAGRRLPPSFAPEAGLGQLQQQPASSRSPSPFSHLFSLSACNQPQTLPPRPRTCSHRPRTCSLGLGTKRPSPPRPLTASTPALPRTYSRPSPPRPHLRTTLAGSMGQRTPACNVHVHGSGAILIPSSCSHLPAAPFLSFPAGPRRPRFGPCSPLGLGHEQCHAHVNNALHVNSAMQALYNQCSMRDS